MHVCCQGCCKYGPKEGLSSAVCLTTMQTCLGRLCASCTKPGENTFIRDVSVPRKAMERELYSLI